MKKSLLALAVLGAFASAASAQSSVTLSGMLDAAVQHTGTNTGSDWALGGAGSAFNNFTLSGKEDLGGGMNAFFTMNHRFRIQDGTINSAPNGTNTTFYRNVFVGLGGSFGDVRLGRMLMPLQEWNGAYDPWYGGYTLASTHTGGITATIRAQQAIYYRSPNMGGLSVHAAIASATGQLQAETQNDFGSSAPAVASVNVQRPEGFAVTYGAGPLRVTAAYDRNYADFKTSGLYGQYNFGVAVLNVQYENGDGLTSATGSKEKVKAFSVAADIPMGVILGKVGYLRYNSDLTAKDATKFGFGGEYSLSKRTLLYSDFAKASGDRLSVGQKKSVFDFGLRHKF